MECWQSEQRERLYRAYVTDVLQMISENTARAVSKGTYLSAKWRELSEEKKIDYRSPDEIAFDIITRAGLKLGGE